MKTVLSFATKKSLLLVSVFLWGSVLAITTQAQSTTDTLLYDVKTAEAIFFENNLALIAANLDISIADAQVMQAKVWPNPSLTLDQIQLYKNATTESSPALFGDFWRDRTFSAQLEQLIYTAGKRRKNIALEMKNKSMKEVVFQDLLQSLKSEFRQHAAELQYYQHLSDALHYQLAALDKLYNGEKKQLDQGQIAKVDIFRLKALQINLQSQINELNENITEHAAILKTLMYINPQSYIIIKDYGDLTGTISQIKQLQLDELLNLTDKNTTVRIAQQQTSISEALLKLERANSVPDVQLNMNYDRNGSVMLNFIGVGFSMDLPVFNRNKGNIKAAQYGVQQSKRNEQLKIAEVNNAIVKKWTDLQQAVKLYESIDLSYIQEMDTLTQSVIKNFANRNLSLVAFLDYFQSFRESQEMYFNAMKNINIKKEDLNYLTGGGI